MGGSLGETSDPYVYIIFALPCLLANLVEGPSCGLYSSFSYFVVRLVVMLSGARLGDLRVI